MSTSESSSHLRHASLVWTGALAAGEERLVFQGQAVGAAAGATVTLDADGVQGPSPAVALLLAAAGCSGADVVSILDKMRAGLSDLRIEITGTKREEHPRRFVALHLTFRMRGTSLDESRARRAIDLSLEKYCSVVHSLAPDIRVTWDLVLE